MYFHVEDKLRHLEWRKLLKKEQRRHKRIKLAKLRDGAFLAASQNVYYESQLVGEQAALKLQEQTEQVRHRQHKTEWQARDLALHALFLHIKNTKEQREKKERQQQELIKKEWESKQKQEQNTQKTDEENLKSQLLLQLVQGALVPDCGDSSTNPEPPSPLQDPAHQVCAFFTKTGACRFGNRCSRSHVYPAVSRTLLLPNMYAAPGAIPGGDSDAALEHDDTERRHHFREFFQDFCSEASKHGGLLEVRVCCNTVHHLRGNVYLRYERTCDAVAAASALHGRYYAGKVVTCLFVPVDNFRAAICGVYWRKLCPKGGGCNFLHPYLNPDNEYTGVPQHWPSHQHRNEGPSRSSLRSSGSSRRSHSRSPRLSRSRRSYSRSPRLSRSRRSYSRSPRLSRSSKRSKSPASARSLTRAGSPSSKVYSSRRQQSDRSHRQIQQRSSRSSRSLRSRSKSPRLFKRKHSKSKQEEKCNFSPTVCSRLRTPTPSPRREASPSKTRRKRKYSQSPSKKQSASLQQISKSPSSVNDQSHSTPLLSSPAEKQISK